MIKIIFFIISLVSVFKTQSWTFSYFFPFNLFYALLNYRVLLFDLDIILNSLRLEDLLRCFPQENRAFLADGDDESLIRTNGNLNYFNFTLTIAEECPTPV